ncbi:hypothetical protein [Streptomyces sp. NPDC056337]|uniref:hypothetical protein n=1 Tax=Streptomyces sp. NPDC056337 TaxID=3345787 RepID=UPI0035D7A886
MGFRIRRSETAKLGKTVDVLPRQVAAWTPQQHAKYVTQSDRAMREQNETKESNR